MVIRLERVHTPRARFRHFGVMVCLSLEQKVADDLAFLDRLIAQQGTTTRSLPRVENVYKKFEPLQRVLRILGTQLLRGRPLVVVGPNP